MLYGILKEGFSAYCSPVMIISRKLTKDKIVVTDLRHLNVRIAKNNIAYPLVRDMFSVLGSSKCEVLSVLDLKDAFIHSNYQTTQRNIVEYFHTLVAHPICIRECVWRLNIFPSIRQSHINTILDCLQSRNIVRQSWMISYLHH